jgi:NAD(P)-dependent dehydrogenase (short-subunit alcohol dehydrogenase family)
MSKILLVTGGGRGIGAATARLAGARGYAVAVNYLHNQEAAEAVVRDIERGGGTAIAIQGDVAVEDDVLRLFATVDERLGRITALVNNAGILDRQVRLDEMQAARMQRIFATNIFGAFICAREAVRRMSTRHGGEGGAIVNVSSAASRIGSPNEFIDYAASKGALDSLTIGLSKEVGTEGIRVNGVRPGLIYTDIHDDSGNPNRIAQFIPGVPMQRGGTAEEVAHAILWLLSDEASYVTGINIDVTGGR